VYIWTCSIPSCKFAGPWPPSASTNSLNYSVVKRGSSHGTKREFLGRSTSALRSVGRGWEYRKVYPALRNHTTGVDLWKLGNIAWDQDLGNIDCVFRIMKWCLYTFHCTVYLCYPYISVRPTSPPPVSQSFPVSPLSPYAPYRLSTSKLNGAGEKRIFLPQWSSSESVSSLNWRLQVLVQLHYSTVCSQIDRIFIYSKSSIENTCHIII